MERTVGIFGFEPALRSALRSLLAREPGLKVVEDESGKCDIVLAAPSSVEWLQQLRQRYPEARLLAMVEWHRRRLYSDSPIDDYIDGLGGYDKLIEQIRASD